MIVKIPEDIYAYQGKNFGNFTTRQVVCGALSLLVIAPAFIGLYFLTHDINLAALVALILGMPIVMCGIFRKDGQPLEKVIWYKIQWKFKYSQKRKYVMSNLYEDIQKYVDKEREQVNETNTADKIKK